MNPFRTGMVAVAWCLACGTREAERPAAASASPAAAAAVAAVAAPASLCAGADSLLRAAATAFPNDTGDVAPAVTGPDSVTFSYTWARKTAPGCVVRAKGAKRRDTTGLMHAVELALGGAGWSQRADLYSADGPDGSVVGFARGPVLCLLEGKWDGGDDSDTTYVPKPDYEVLLTCAPLRADDVPKG